jgi:hypothetical protein
MADKVAVKITEWQGKSGKVYPYSIHDLNTNFRPMSANYIVAKKTSPDVWKAVYIGESGNMNECFQNHKKLTCITKNGATHILVHESSPDPDARHEEENDLLAKITTT